MAPRPEETLTTRSAAACGGAPACPSHAERLQGLGVLAGGMAHDFNNLLVGILGHADLALADLPEGSAARESVEEIARTALRAAGLTRNILSYAVPAGAVPAGAGATAVDLNLVVRETCGLVEPSLAPGVALIVHLHDDLPLVRGDATEISQVTMNLVVNAGQATEGTRGSVVVRTGRETSSDTRAGTFESAEDTGAVFIEVADEGCGIPVGIRDLIFEPFFTTRPRGHGLGLAMVKDIVERHGGRVQVESEPGQGSVFRIVLPVWEGEQARVVAVLPAQTGWAPSGPVLVIDDEAPVRDMAARLLRRVGIEAMVAEDVEEGLERLARCPEVSVVLLDLHMRGLSGLDAVRALHMTRPGVPVLMTSGSGGSETDSLVGPAAAAGFLPKPYRLEELIGALRNAVEG